MSLKAVEMQIAIPRTNEVTGIQNQLSHKPAYDQAALAAKLAEERERQLKQATKAGQSDAALIRDDEQRGAGGDRQQPAAKPGKKGVGGRQAAERHPYKGQHIDFSL